MVGDEAGIFIEATDGRFESTVVLHGEAVTPVELPSRALSESFRLTVGLIK